MDRNGLILGVSAVLFGITVVMLLAGIIVNPFFLLVSIPFGSSAYLLWYQASGKLSDDIRQGESTGTFGAGSRNTGFNPGSFGAGSSTSENFASESARRAQQYREKARANQAVDQATTITQSDAYRILEIEPIADEAEIKAAYRQKVKECHPDTPSGDEEMFKKVSRAYEVLSN